jgi:antitoxin component of RelBE/YafQ-DinJ toxin-antitoxin module
MSKLTLSVDKNVISQARRVAKHHGVSISKMVEAYLAAVAAPSERPSWNAPILHSLRGSLKKADIEQHRARLTAKFR